MSKTVSLTYDQALEGLQKAVQDRGEGFVYQEAYPEHRDACYYFETDGQPACIVGHVLHQNGYDGPDPVGDVHRVREVGVLACDEEAALLLGYAQTFQDRGSSWGEAVASAVIRAESAFDEPCATS